MLILLELLYPLPKHLKYKYYIIFQEEYNGKIKLTRSIFILLRDHSICFVNIFKFIISTIDNLLSR